MQELVIKQYKKNIPSKIRFIIRNLVNKFLIHTSIIRNKIILKKLKGKEKYRVAILLKIWDGWKLEYIYKSMEKHPRFSPIIIICPMINKGRYFLENELEKNISHCEDKSYDYFVAYDYKSSSAIDIKVIIKPDIILIDGPNKHSSGKLYIDNFLDKLTCYFPYSFRNSTFYQYDYNNVTANLSWRCFYETQIHKELSQKYAANKGRNVVALGYPFFDYMIDAIPVKIKKERKVIIWAPHWTIKGFQDTPLNWSCFINYADFVLDLAMKYKNQIEFILKPHPLLESILKNDALWGIKKTKDYFEKWNRIENCSIVTGDYRELFFKSDAMIHDCGSFTTEYLIHNKPIAYTVSDTPLENRFSKYGEIILSAHQLVKSKKDFERFIYDVINENDVLKSKREDIIKRFDFNNKISIADKIVNYIDNQLD